MNGAFSTGPDPGPALLTDGQQMAFCAQRKRGQRGETKRRDIEELSGSGGREGGGVGGFSGLFSLGPYMQV